MLRLKPQKKKRRKVRISTLAGAGAAPGSFRIDPEALPTKITAMLYGPDDVEIHEDVQHGDIKKLIDKQRVTWFDVVGLGSGEMLQEIGNVFGLHPLLLEDVVNVHQRPKIEDYGKLTFTVCRMNRSTERLMTEQVSMVSTDQFVITFQEQEGDCLDAIRDRIKNKVGRIRTQPADYLGYAIIDTIVDHYFPLLERHDHRLDELEESILAEHGAEELGELHDIRRQLLAFRRYVWPLQGAITSYLTKRQGAIRDELIDQQREIDTGLIDLYLSIESRRMNEIAKWLTIMATIVLPMTLVAGVYGMNFDPEVSPWNMPELSWFYGYPFALGLMALTGLGMIYFFVRKGWIFTGKKEPSRQTR